MKKEKNSLSDKIWKGEPLPEDFINRFPRPSEKTREKIYKFARKNAELNSEKGLLKKLLFQYRGRLSYAEFGTCVAALLIFVWLGIAGRDLFRRTRNTNNSWNEMVAAAATVAEESKISLLTEQSGVDIDENIFAVELFLVDEELSSLENERWCDLTLNTKGQL